jgi:ATP-dependent helicase HepA
MEPDLGLGTVVQTEERLVSVHFPGPEEDRLYDSKDAPLRRLRLQSGAKFSHSTESRTVQDVKEEENLLSYLTEKGWIHESDLPPYLDALGPRDQILDGSWDRPAEMDLRFEALLAENHFRSNPNLGLQGGRIRLYPHQLDLAQQLCERPKVRAMLADEVGLGKTIEAILVAHRLLLSERIQRILIVVPESLIHQWFAECYLRFNLPFRLLDEGFLENLDDEEQGLLSQSRVICSLEQLQLSDFSEEDWDLVIVDEVHKVESLSDDGKRVSKLCQSASHALLLSATPSDLDSEEHFRKLSWLEPDVYNDLNLYRKHQSQNREIGALFASLDEDELPPEDILLKHLPKGTLQPHGSAQELLASVLDLHGPAYHLVKHTRKTVEGFPQRRAHLMPLEGDIKRLKKEWRHECGETQPFRYQGMESDPRVMWLSTFLEENPEAKVLALASSRLKVEAIIKGLERLGAKDIARFHEGQSLMERDRQAAWFSEKNGPPLLISSNLGAEGRNFQTASELLLFDINTDPALLEQRIGRLDRIGQERDINIHLPYVSGSPQELLFRWFHEAFSAIERPWCGVDAVHRAHAPALLKLLAGKDWSHFDKILNDTQKDYQQLLSDLELDRDHLLERCWHHPSRSHELEANIVREDQDPSLEHFMQQAWELAGIDAIPIGPRTFRLKANDGYGHPFPGFRERGMNVTFQRSQALKRDDLSFLSWDHPMVRDTASLLTQGEHGRASVVKVTSSKPNLLLDICYRIHHRCPSHLHADRFFPPTPLRVSLDREGRSIRLKLGQLSNKWEALHRLPLPLDDFRLWLDKQLNLAEELAGKQAEQLIQEAENKRAEEASRYIRRIEGLIDINPSITPSELKEYKVSQDALKEGLSKPVLELDAIRLIVCQPN